MGFLDGFLGGVVQQHQRIEDQNREDAAASQAREQGVLQHLLTSDDPEIKSLAVAGMLDSTRPKKRKGGFSGWLGEMQANPHMDRIRALVAHDQAVGHMVPTEAAHAAGQATASGDPATGAALATAAASDGAAGHAPAGPSTVAPPGSPAGSPVTEGSTAAPASATPQIETPPTEAGSAAMPGGKSLTEVGSAPPSPTTTPAAAAPEPGMPATASAVLGQRGPATPATTAVGLGAPPPNVATAGGPAPRAILGQPTTPSKPEGAGPLSPRGDVFRSPETQTRLTKKATAQGDVEGDVAGYVAAGLSPADALTQVRAERMRRGGGAAAGGYQGVAGEMPDPNAPGKMIRVNGAFDRAKGTYVGTDPDSPYYGIPIPGFISRQTGAQKTPEQIAADTTARLNATNAAKLDAPIGVANAQRYGVPAHTTMRQLMDKIPLSQQDQDKVHGISTLEGSLDTVERLLPNVFPDVAPGIIGRIKTALSLFGQSASKQPDITQLNAAIASTMAGIVRANGVTQRLNQKELDLAAKQMIDTSVLHGDTLESAQAKMEILRDLISRVEQGPISQTVGAPPPTAATPPAAAAAPPNASASTSPAAAGAPPPTAAPAAAAPAAKGTAAPAGYTMVGGVLYKDGKPY